MYCHRHTMVRTVDSIYGRGSFPIFRGAQHQSGGRIILRGVNQRGAGIGGLFRGLMKSVTPLLKRGLAHAGKRALTVGADVLRDVVENNTSVKDAVSNRARQELASLNPINVAKTVVTASRSSRAPKRRRQPPKKAPQKKKKKKKSVSRSSITL